MAETDAVTRGRIEARLAELGIELPAAAAPAANYLPFAVSGRTIYTAGQLPLRDGRLISSGLLGRDMDVAAGQDAARQCAINVLAQVRAAAGELDRVVRIVKITVFVASVPGFTEQHLVANGASDLFAQVFGPRGQHARSAVGCAALPMNAPVEVEAIVEIEA